MTPKIYRPDQSCRLSPRIPMRLRKAVGRVSKKTEMPAADVIRYGFEAVVLLVHTRTLRLVSHVPGRALDAMITIRTSRKILRRVSEIYRRERENDADLLHADVLRRLVATVLPMAETRGMAYVMGLRERALGEIRWDKQFERDVKAGRLDSVISRARQEHRGKLSRGGAGARRRRGR